MATLGQQLGRVSQLVLPTERYFSTQRLVQVAILFALLAVTLVMITFAFDNDSHSDLNSEQDDHTSLENSLKAHLPDFSQLQSEVQTMGASVSACIANQTALLIPAGTGKLHCGTSPGLGFQLSSIE